MTVKQLLVGVLVVGTLGTGAKVLTGGEDPVEVATVDSDSVVTTTPQISAPEVASPSAAPAPAAAKPVAPKAGIVTTTTRPRTAAVVTTSTTAPAQQAAPAQPVTVTTVATTPPTTQPAVTTTTTAPTPAGSCTVTPAQSEIVIRNSYGTEQTITLTSTLPNAPARISVSVPKMGGGGWSMTRMKEGTTDANGTFVATFVIDQASPSRSQPVEVGGGVSGTTRQQNVTCRSTFYAEPGA